jgi:rubredoxin/uncharacterized membrane protein
MRVWQCTVCKYIHEGDAPPEKCPICGVDASKFIEIDPADIPDTRLDPRPGGKKERSKPGKVEEAPQTLMKKIGKLLCKYHAHPIAVHTPNGVLPAAVILFVLAWIFSSSLLGKAAVINLLFVMTSLPFVIYTGVLEWKNKYNGALTLMFKLKILAATVTSTACATSIIWFIVDPDILQSGTAPVFLFVNIIMLTAAGIAGHIGGKLVFKD